MLNDLWGEGDIVGILQGWIFQISSFLGPTWPGYISPDFDYKSAASTDHLVTEVAPILYSSRVILLLNHPDRNIALLDQSQIAEPVTVTGASLTIADGETCLPLQ